MPNIVEALLILTLFFKDYTYSLRLVEVRIPNYVIKGSVAQLECRYDLDGEALYSVKWYKDGNEFYRYVPRDMPPAQTFLLPGVSVDVHNSSDAMVTLRNVNLQSAGRFRCEVSGEAPSFQTVTEHADMVVVSLPDQGPPKITGGRPRYQIGDWVHINCTAGRSKPAVQLTWSVNGHPAKPDMTRKYNTTISGRDGLETSTLGLHFRVKEEHFLHGDMKLKCVAALSTLYWRSNEESVEGDRPLRAPVLESRETAYASNSRADPVQASSTDSIIMGHAPNLFIILLFTTAIVAAGCLLECLHLQQLRPPTTTTRSENPRKMKIMLEEARKTKRQQTMKEILGMELTRKSTFFEDFNEPTTSLTSLSSAEAAATATATSLSLPTTNAVLCSSLPSSSSTMSFLSSSLLTTSGSNLLSAAQLKAQKTPAAR